MLRSILACIVLWALSIHAQTETVLNPAGFSIVQVVTTDANGLPTTQIVQTLTTAISNTNTATSSTSTTTATTPAVIPTVTPAPVQQGPVGQPAPTVGQPGGVTPYTYTTIVGGVTQVLTDNFTPTNPPTLSPTIPTTGSVMPYSVWLSAYGSQTTSSSKSHGERLMAWCPEHLVSLAVALAVTTLLS